MNGNLLPYIVCKGSCELYDFFYCLCAGLGKFCSKWHLIFVLLNTACKFLNVQSFLSIKLGLKTTKYIKINNSILYSWFLLEHRIKQFPRKAGVYRNNSGIASFYEKKPRSSNRGSSKNPKKDSTRWQTFPVDTSKVRQCWCKPCYKS